eukprot:6817311-Alexandrium_andersonii.AAC.1
MSASLVGSEMCIRDSATSTKMQRAMEKALGGAQIKVVLGGRDLGVDDTCLLYTSDAADDM